MAGKRKQIDWEAIEREFRAGQLSLREIGREYGVSAPAITKKAKKEGWSRDLSNQVRKAVNAKLVNTEVNRGNASVNEAEVIEAAAERGAEVIRLHRADIANLRNLEAQLLEELADNPTKLYITQYQGQIIQSEVGIAVTERASALQALAGVQHKRIQLERQAFNLDEKQGPVSDLNSVLDEVASRNASLVKDDDGDA